jgi:hypothetical protein
MEIFRRRCRARRIALLTWQRMEAAGSEGGGAGGASAQVETVLVEVVQNGDYEGAFSTLAAERADALFVVESASQS